MMLWLWKNHHFRFYFVFRKFENNVESPSILPPAQAQALSVTCLPERRGPILTGFSFSAFQEEITNKMFPPLYRQIQCKGGGKKEPETTHFLRS